MLEALSRALDGNPALIRRNRLARLTIAAKVGEAAWTVRLGDPIAVVVAETLAARSSERQGRLIDKDQSSAMERKKLEGYF